jgi:hypothetical protein
MMEKKIMSKSNNVSRLDNRPLADSDLDVVTGGMLFLNPPPSMSLAEACLAAVKVGLTDCIGTLGSLGAPPKA